MARDVGADLSQQLASDGADGDARGRFPRARALQHVAHVRVSEFEESRQVRVARARRVDLLDVDRNGPGIHPLLPARVVAVRDEDRHRAAQRPSVSYPGADLHRVLLDLHPPPAPVSELAARHLTIEPRPVELESGWQALDDRDESWPVRLAGGCEAELHGRPRLA